MFHSRSIVQIGRKSLSRMISNYSVDNILTASRRENCMKKMCSAPSALKGSHGVKGDKKAAVLVPLCIDNGEVALLYTLRSMDLKSHKGDVSFPGGKVDETDKNCTETAVRETEEELGISRNIIDVWGEADWSLPSKNYELAVTPVVGFINNYSDLKLQINPSEVQEAFTVSLEKLCDPQYFALNSFKSGWVLPAYMGGNHKIWGLTAIVTHMFLSSLLTEEEYTIKIDNFKQPKSKV